MVLIENHYCGDTDDMDAIVNESLTRFIKESHNVRDLENGCGFIYEIEYSLNRGKSMKVGLNAARDFQPAVHFISRVGDQVLFSFTEFCDLSNRIPTMEKHLHEKNRKFVDGVEKF